ncbi:MAG: hypothetical protein ACLP5H_16600 [Desulfomonilaceae bacterium]
MMDRQRTPVAYVVVCKPFFHSAFSAHSAVNPACSLNAYLHSSPLLLLDRGHDGVVCLNVAENNVFSKLGVAAR